MSCLLELYFAMIFLSIDIQFDSVMLLILYLSSDIFVSFSVLSFSAMSLHLLLLCMLFVTSIFL